MANVTGLKELIQDFKKLGIDIEQGSKIAVTTTALEAANIATKLAPAAFGKLRQSIGVEKEDEFTQSVVANINYAPMVEFGTGGKVDVPQEWQEFASQFKGRRLTNDEFLEQLRSWCRLKGIDESASYPIMITILREGLEPRPFMYPAYQKAKVEFPKRMKDVITNATKSR